MYCSESCKHKAHWISCKAREILHSQDKRSYYRKLFLIEKLGGACSKCGYAKNYSALEFHHLDPSIKEIPLSGRQLSNSSMERILMEVEKCILVCSNCHREIEHPEAILTHGAIGSAPD